MAQAATGLEASPDAVSDFEAHRAALRRSRRATEITFAAGFAVAVALAVWVSNFYPARLAAGVPRIFEYFATILPDLRLDMLLKGRDAAGEAVEGSLTYWFADLPTYLRLLAETVAMAATATLLGAGLGFLLCFPAARNLSPDARVSWAARRFMEVCRGVPEILFALILVFMVGIGPLAGVIAIAIHTTGALGKLFAEVNENASSRPMEGIRATGGTWFDEMRYGVVPQVLPNFVSYTLLRFEINVRASSIVGFVGAGGIGQELYRVISFYSDDRVLAILILIVVMVTLIDLLSERLRMRLTGRAGLA